MKKEDKITKQPEKASDEAKDVAVPEPKAEEPKTEEPVVEEKPAVEEPATKELAVAEGEVVKPKEKKSDKKNLALFFFFFFLGIAAVIVFGFFALKTEFSVIGFKNTRTIEYLADYQDDFGNICYGNRFTCKKADITVDGEVNTSVLGDYELTIHATVDDQYLELKQTVSVKDTTAPEIKTEVEKVSICPNENVSAFDFSVSDNYDGDITDKAVLNHVNQLLQIEATDTSGNQSVKELPATVEDTIAPVITLNGDGETTIYLYDPYVDAGATVLDNCDDVEIVVEGSVDVYTPGTYEITYSATDKSGNSTSIKRKVNVVRPTPVSGTNYLTFDDGPSDFTPVLLDILKKYNVKATFFVTGSGGDDTLKREYDEGHSIGLHTYTHSYSYVYSNEGTFFYDLERVQERVKNATGFTSTLMRFPGGSSNTVSMNYDGGTHIMSQLVNSVEARGFTYFDWNVSSGDAGGATTPEQVYANVVNNLKVGGNSVVLQHDTKMFSINAVERIIQYGLSRGFTFERLTPDSYTAHHGVNN